MEMTQFENDRREACEKSRALMVEQEGVIVIGDDARYEEAGPVLALLRDLVRSGKAFFADTIQKADQAHTAAIAARNAAIKEPQDAEKRLNQAMKDYIVVRNRKKAALDKKAEDDRLAAAAKVEQAGDPALANAMLDAPVPKTAAAPKVEGLAAPRDNWKARVTIHAALVEYAAQGDHDLVEPNMTVLNQKARDHKREGHLLPGVECYNDPIIPKSRT